MVNFLDHPQIVQDINSPEDEKESESEAISNYFPSIRSDRKRDSIISSLKEKKKKE